MPATAMKEGKEGGLHRVQSKELGVGAGKKGSPCGMIGYQNTTLLRPHYAALSVTHHAKELS